MAKLGIRLKRFIMLAVTTALFLLVFVADLIRKSVGIELSWVLLLRDIAVVAAFALLYLVLESLWHREQSPAKKLGFALVLALVVGAASGVMLIISSSGFDIKNYSLIPLGFDSVVWSNIYAVVYGTTALIVLLTIRDIIFSKRRKETQRNFMILVGLLVLSALVAFTSRPLETGFLPVLLLVVTILAMVLNSFRLTWIVYLSKREKLYSIIYGTLLFVLFIGFDVLVSRSMEVGRSLLFYSPALRSFVASVSLFATIYFGMTFISTLFHLPTAEAFDRKISEVSSLHNLSRLVTQVFDFNELVESVTTMTLGVCEARSAWLEILHEAPSAMRGLMNDSRMNHELRLASLKNISREETQAIMEANGEMLRKLILNERKPIVIDSVKRDRRTQALPMIRTKFQSMAIVPLVTHEALIGILYATKEVEYGFDRDDVEVISAFADQAAIAIENSRLIEKSIERERLLREMMLAQEMQRKLLPQQIPIVAGVDLEALSTPAFEVGGDYYDFTMLDDHHFGMLVGDVSGKGVSAAFYMAEMKGIFQSLGKIYPDPKEFLSKAHETLVETIDKRSFISLIYAVLDLRTGMMTVARAGHCPMLFVSEDKAEYIKPTGLGLGMGSSAFFARTITQQQVQFLQGDLAIFYTDGVTEAHPKSGDEFGYDRLCEVARRARDKSAEGVKDAIILAVDEHMQHEPPEDDLTIVVMKWLHQPSQQHSPTFVGDDA